VTVLREELARLGADAEAPVVLALRTVAAPAGRTTTARSARRAPELVAEELRRQRRVAKVTLGALISAGAAWVVALIGSDFSQPYPQSSRPVLPTWAFPTYPPQPRFTAPLPAPGHGLPDSGYGLPESGSGVPESGYGLPLPRPSFTLHPHPSLLLPVARVHAVAPGDTLSGIACRYGTTVQELQELNDMGARTDLRAGQKLWVPAPEEGRPARCG
jgi:hypothetical protein